MTDCIKGVRYNSKHRKLPVFDKTQVNGGLLFKEAVCCYGRE